MKKSLVAATTLLALGGCSLFPSGGQAQRAIESAIASGIDDRRAYNDTKAAVLPVLACDISVGAYARMAESSVKRGVALLCGLDQGQAVAADLNAAAAILEQLRLMGGGVP